MNEPGNVLGYGNAKEMTASFVRAMNQGNWQPEHAPKVEKVESLTNVLNATLSKMQAIESRLNGCLYKLAMHPTEQRDGTEKQLQREYHAVEAAAELRKLAERLQTLTTDLDERL